MRAKCPKTKELIKAKGSEHTEFRDCVLSC